MVSRPSPLKAYGLAITAAALWAVFGNVAKFLFNSGMGPPLLTLMRLVVSVVGLLLAVGAARVWGDRVSMFARVSSTEAMKDWKGLVAFGAASAGMMYTFYEAIDHLGVPLGILLQYTHPLIIMILGVVFSRERIRLSGWASGLMIVAGTAFLTGVLQGSDVGVGASGLMWGFLAAVTNAAYLMVGAVSRDRHGSMAAVLWGFGIGCLIMAPWALITGMSTSFTMSLGLLPAILSIGILGTLVPFSLILAATRYATPAEVGLASGAEAVFAVVIAGLWFADFLRPLQFVGGAMILAGVSVAYRRGVYYDVQHA